MTAANSPPEPGDRLEELRDERGDYVSLDEIGEIVNSLLGTMDGDISAIQIRVAKELEGLVNYIEQTKAELASLSPEEIHDHHIPSATDQLDAVVQATEEATGSILDAAEELEHLAGELPEDVAQRLTGITTRIFEASNFQDITGQRITKVVDTLKHIEGRIAVLAQACGHSLSRQSEAKPSAPEDLEKALLQGPQLSGGNSQEEIDALLADFD